MPYHTTEDVVAGTERYFAMLRSKSGEVEALKNLASQAKDRVLPVVHIAESPPAAFDKTFAVAWAGRSAAIDGLHNFNVSNSTKVFVKTVTDLIQAGIPIIPSIKYDAPAQYLSAVQQLSNKYGLGVLVKVSPVQIQALAAWLVQAGWKASNIDLVIDAGVVSGYDPAMLAPVVANAINKYLSPIEQWRSITIASSAAPKDMGQLPLGRTNILRTDWHLWEAARKIVGGNVNYGDYGISHPDLSEPPGVAMARATVSARYTVNDAWIVIKGRATGGAKGLPMAGQYLSHAKALASDPSFGGIKGCWADDRITDISTKKSTSGNRTTWVTIGVNRHLNVVAGQLP